MSLSIETQDVKHLQKVMNHRIPLVLFDRVSNKLPISCVENDDELGAYDMTIHLIDQGYTNFMWMGGGAKCFHI